MPRTSNARLGIPLERTVPHRRPGRWMPFVWVIFAAALTGGIITTIRIVIPEADLGPTVVHKREPEPKTMPTMTVALAEAGSIDFPSDMTSDHRREPVAPVPVERREVPVEVAVPVEPPAPATEKSEGTRETETVDASRSSAATLVQPAALELRRDGRVSGVLYLKAGDQVDVVSHEGGDLVRVRWKDAEGFVGQGSLKFTER